VGADIDGFSHPSNVSGTRTTPWENRVLEISFDQRVPTIVLSPRVAPAAFRISDAIVFNCKLEY
jgi:hypothetical protein